MTDLDLTADLVDAAREARRQQQANAPDLDAAATRAQEAAQEAERAAADLQAARIENHPAATASAVMGKAMREIGEALDEARALAVADVAAGLDPAGAWVRYRIAAARLTGEWAALGAWYSTQTGGAAPPPGPLHRIPPLPAAPGDAQSPGAESFAQFLETAVRAAAARAETEAQATANKAWWSINTQETTP